MIGLFDSGIGGLTVVRELLRQSPEASFVYLGDTARTPYGNKSPETVIRYAREDADFLLNHGATSLVVACNTVSAVAVPSLRAAHPSIPLYEVITPAVEDALSITRGRIGVIGTRATIQSHIYRDKIQILARERSLKTPRVFEVACPLFVPLVEEGWIKQGVTKKVIRYYLDSLKKHQIDTLILGCTHYPLLADLIQQAAGKRVRLIDSASAVIRRVLADRTVFSKTPAQQFFLSDQSEHSLRIAERWLHRPISVERVVLPMTHIIA